MSLRVGALASGRGSNVAALIAACAEGWVPAEVVLVLSDVEGAPVLERAREAGVRGEFLDPGSRRAVLSVEAEETYVQTLQGAGVELLVLAGFMRIIRRPLLRAFRNRIVNIHPSLLPAFPGLNAQRQAYDYGAKVAGATVHFVDEGVDTGPIILQSAVEVGEDDSPERLADRILAEEHRILPEAVRLFAEDRLRIEGRRVRVRQA